MSDFLTIEDIIGINDMSISAYGCIYGIRDINLLKSAVSRSQCGYYNDIIEEGCALMENLIINYPFIDSNKRTAFASFHCFLKINGMDINTSSDVLYDLIIKWITSDPHERYEMMVWDIKSIIN